MAAAGPRGGGRELAPATPRESSPERKPRTAGSGERAEVLKPEESSETFAWKDIQKRPTLLQRGSSTFKQGAQPPHVKEEEEELRTTQEDGECLLGPEEDDLTKLPLTVVSVKFEDHEDKLPESSCWSCASDVHQRVAVQEERPTQLQGGSKTLKQENPQLPHVKEEEEEVRITQEGECFPGKEEANLTQLPLTGVFVKLEDHEDKSPESSKLHYSPGEEKRGAGPPSSSSPQHMTTEAERDHRGGSQAENLLAPLSDSNDTTSRSPEGEDRYDTQEPLSSDTDWESDIRIRTDNKHSEGSKKKTGKKIFTCSVCAKSFISKSDLTRHMTTHTGEKPFGCSVCAKRFSLKGILTQHMLTHTGEKPFSCSVCGKSFIFQRDVTQHMRTHTGEKPFSCSVCCKLFSQRSSVISHMRTHTGERPFNCSVCDQRFSQKTNLISHMRIHTGQKPFSCSVCDENFYSKSSFAYHMLKHTGEKVFSCSICGKSFLQKEAMPRHMRTHTGEKPFSCSVCCKQFANKSSILSHMKTHKGEKPFKGSLGSKSYSH